MASCWPRFLHCSASRKRRSKNATLPYPRRPHHHASTQTIQTLPYLLRSSASSVSQFHHCPREVSAEAKDEVSPQNSLLSRASRISMIRLDSLPQEPFISANSFDNLFRQVAEEPKQVKWISPFLPSSPATKPKLKPVMPRWRRREASLTVLNRV